MAKIAINHEVCRKDGLCAMVCPRSIFRQLKKNTHPRLVGTEFCMACGACVSICPGGAISHSRYPEGSITPVRSDILPSYDQLLETMRSRRSRRIFKKKPVLKEDIEKVLDATRFAPSEHNVQDTEIIVVQDREKINQIAALTADYYQGLVRTLENPVGRLGFRIMFGKRSTNAILDFIPDMRGIAEQFHAGKDFILRDAPVLLVFCADRVGGFPEINAQLAAQNAILAAESLGLACFFAGFVLRASRRMPGIGKLIGLPETHDIFAMLALGYAGVKFRKWPERKPARVYWVE